MCLLDTKEMVYLICCHPWEFTALLVAWRLITLDKQPRKTTEVLLRASVNFRPPGVDICAHDAKYLCLGGYSLCNLTN